jgi:hypothetical protein
MRELSRSVISIRDIDVLANRNIPITQRPLYAKPKPVCDGTN